MKVFPIFTLVATVAAFGVFLATAGVPNVEEQVEPDVIGPQDFINNCPYLDEGPVPAVPKIMTIRCFPVKAVNRLCVIVNDDPVKP